VIMVGTRSPKGRRKSGTRRIADLEKQVKELVQIVGAAAKNIAILEARVDDLEYFREHAKEILDIAEVQDS
jgi:hypothetical protein